MLAPPRDHLERNRRSRDAQALNCAVVESRRAMRFRKDDAGSSGEDSAFRTMSQARTVRRRICRTSRISLVGLPTAARSRVRRAKVGGERGIRTLGRVSPTHAFQACSFNHSDISPFRINKLRAVGQRLSHTRATSQRFRPVRLQSVVLSGTTTGAAGNCVRRLNVSRSLTGVYKSLPVTEREKPR